MKCSILLKAQPLIETSKNLCYNYFMKKTKKMPLGIQSFEDLRNKDYAYIDKTKYIFDLSNSAKSYFLSRPRRFGKSLLLSTMKAYFLGQKELFDGLAIQELEESRENPWQEYPVLYLDLNAEKYTEEEDLINILNRNLQSWEEYYNPSNIDKSLSGRFFNVIKKAYEQTGKQVVILIDEYDKPLLQSFGDNEELNDKYRKILKAFYGVIKSADQYLRFVFLTGVTRFSKVSIFSDLNNLTDISFQNKYAGICGITQKELEDNFEAEIEELAEENNLSVKECLATLKKKYDGYIFTDNYVNLYNPFSILNTLSSLQLKNYWFATGTPTFLVEYLKEGHYNIPDLDGNIIMGESNLSTYKADSRNPLPILFQAGYLTIKEYDKEYNVYKLAFPNDEVRYAFLENLFPSYTGVHETKTAFSIVEFTKDIRANRVDEFMERLQSIISGIPYDNFAEEDLKLREQNYQTAVYLVFALMGQFVRTEVHCATGRADCEVETKDAIYIFEFKLTGNGSAEDAIQQIKDKGYADKYKSSGKKLVLIGSSFNEEKRTIDKWRAENNSN